MQISKIRHSAQVFTKWQLSRRGLGPTMEPVKLQHTESSLNSAWALIVGRKNYETLCAPIAKLMYVSQCFPGLFAAATMLSVTRTEN